MTDATAVYPPSPAGVPADFTAPTLRYRALVIATLVSIALFLAAYAALLAGSGWLVWVGFTYDFGSGRAGLWGHAGAIAGGIMLLAFLGKGLFKRRTRDRSGFIEITRDDEPVLFGFLDRLIAETGAPTPRRVYLSADVNAAVFYDSSFLSLFLPVRKNLVIGLGLVNMLSLSELKAVLAHELGHFSQRSMRLGSYVYVANHALVDMIYARDGWDELLERWSGLDIRISWIAWLIRAVVWVLRHVLGLLFRVINIAHAALSRDMEFAADRIAVSVTGSDAICHALLRAGFADVCLDQTLEDLSLAREKHLHTRDIFHHQERAAEYLRIRAKKPDWGVAPALPADPGATTTVFPPGSGSHPSMWSSHPPNAEREASAKARYIRSVLDQRPAWVLFREPEAVRRRVTEHVLRRQIGDLATLSEPEAVQRIIDEEREESFHDPRYRDVYEGRWLEPADLDGALAAARAEAEASAGELGTAHAALLGPAFQATAERRQRLADDRRELFRQLAGDRAPAAVTFRGETRDAGELPAVLEEIGREWSELDRWLGDFDQRVLEVHVRMAAALGGEALAELEARYRFQATVQAMARRLDQAREAMDPVLELLSSDADKTREDMERVLERFMATREVLAEILAEAAGVVVPAMSNVEPGAVLRPLLLDGRLVSPEDDVRLLTGEWLGAVMNQCGEVRSRLERFIRKGVSGILREQEATFARWHARFSGDTAAA